MEKESTEIPVILVLSFIFVAFVVLFFIFVVPRSDTAEHLPWITAAVTSILTIVGFKLG